MKSQRLDLRELLEDFFVDPRESTQEVLISDIIQYGYDIRNLSLNSAEEKMLDPGK